MFSKNHLTVGALALAAIATTAAPSNAAIVAQQGFEGAIGDTWAYAITGTGGIVSSASPATDFPASSRIRTGSNSFQHNAATLATSVLTFSPLAIADQDDTTVEIRLAAISTTSGNGLDNSDLVRVFIALDGGAFSATPDLVVEGFGNARWSYSSGTGQAEVSVGTPATKFQPPAGGNRTTDGYSLLLLNLPDSASSFAMKIESTTNSSGEVWAIDDISVTAIAVPEPTTLGILAVGGAALLARRSRRRTA